MNNGAVLGVDGCAVGPVKGWIGMHVHRGAITALYAQSIAELIDLGQSMQPLAGVGIDMPIGLPDRTRRQADVLAKQAVGGKRASTVFMTPTCDAVEQPTHALASARNKELAGEGISAMAYALRARIMEVDAVVRSTAIPMLEVHPEVSFTAMAGAPLTYSKHSWAGIEERRRLLTAAGLDVTGLDPDVTRHASVDDVVDALAVAWTMVRWTSAQAISLPDPPERFSDQLPAAIWA